MTRDGIGLVQRDGGNEQASLADAALEDHAEPPVAVPIVDGGNDRLEFARRGGEVH